MNKIFRIFVEIMFGLQIAALPTLFGIIAGGLIYIKWPNQTGATLGLCCATLGLVGGIIWALRVAREQGTANFVSRINSIPEVDKEEESN